MRIVGAACLVGGVAALGESVLPPYNQFVIARIALLILVTLGLNVLIGTAGLLSLASSAFMGVGAFGVLIVLQRTSLPLVAAIPVVVAGAWCVGWVLGTTSLRLAGFYLALVTLGFLVAFQTGVSHGGTIVGSGYGLIAPIPTAFGWQISIKWLSIISVFAASTCAVLVWSLLNSRLGRAWKTMRANPVAAELAGMNTIRLKTSAFAFSAAIAGFAGTGYAFLQQAVSPQGFDIAQTIDQLAYVVVGGVGSTLGSVLGPLVLELTPEYLRGVAQYRELFLGVVLVVILVVAPRGIAGLLQDLFARVAPQTTRRARIGANSALGLEPRPADASGQLRHWQQGRSAGNDAPVLEFRDVTVRYGGLTAVADLSFAVNPGEIHGLIGPNGAGKTTAINALSGLVGVSGGSIFVNGAEVRSAGKGVPPYRLARYGIGRTFQTPLVVPDLSVLDNVVAGLHSQLRSGLVTGVLKPGFVQREERVARSRAFEALERLGFRGDPYAPVRTLGFGELRRLEIARAIVGRPQLLLLDEPTSGLEVEAAVAMLQQLRILQRESDHSLTVLIVEHNVPLLFAHCETVTAMIEGHAVISASPEEVRADPRVRSSYLGEQIEIDEIAQSSDEEAHAQAT